MSNQIEEMSAPEKKENTRKISWLNIGICFSAGAAFLLVFLFCYGYFQLTSVNITLARMLTDLQNKTVNDDQKIANLQKSVIDLQTTAQKSEELSAKQEQMITDFEKTGQGNLEKWSVLEAQYLVRLANDEAQFTHDLSTALALLERANQILQNTKEDSLLAIRQALANDIANLQAKPDIEITSLYLQLTAMQNQLDQLPLPVNPLPEKTQSIADQTQTEETWWKKGLDHSYQMLRQLVVVRYNGSNALPLLLPDEKTFLYQNLHAQFEGASFALLHRNEQIYQASLTRAVDWSKKYFDQGAPLTQAILLNLEKLRQVNIAPQSVNFSETLQLFDPYFAKTGQVKAQ